MALLFNPPMIQAKTWEEAQREFNEIIRQMARQFNNIYTGPNIPTNRIKDLAITADKIAVNTITASQIAASTITTTELNVTDLANIANLLTVASGKIIIGADAIGSGLDGILINDGTYDRVLIGEVSSNNYGLTIKDAAGNVMINQGSFAFGNAKARAYGATPIVIQTYGGSGGNTIVRLDTESYDPGNNFNNSTWFSGTTTATTANKLEDSGASFTSDLVGYTVKNTTDTTYAQIKGRDSGTVLSISTDIFTSSEGYEIKHSKFVAPITGDYLCIGQVTMWIDDAALLDNNFSLSLFKNGSAVATASNETGSKVGNRQFILPVVDIVPLASDDRVELYATVAANKECTMLPNNASNTYLVCHLMSVTP